MLHEGISIIDFGSQFTQLITRKIRELGCFSEICHPDNFKFSEGIKGIILSGSHGSVEGCGRYISLISEIVGISQDRGIPILGICYGSQLLCNFFGGKVTKATTAEYGKSLLSISNQSDLVKGIPESNIAVWMSHGDSIVSLPENFKKVASTLDCEFALITDEKKKIYGAQFHPEVSHSTYGKDILGNFINICKLSNTWDLRQFFISEKCEILDTVKDSNVIAAVSGGVDSTVAAKLLHQIIPDQLHCFFIDTGFLRKYESLSVSKTFAKLGIPFKIIDASSEFLSGISGISDPEQKRKIIGKIFIDVLERESGKIDGAEFLLQGTLYPDVVESGNKISNTIKSHHNVGGLPEKMSLKLVEPFRLLFKDEVRDLGSALGIDYDALMRHPFPGPGLAIRILGDVTKDKVEILQEVDHIYTNMMRESGLYHDIWQAFAVLLPVRSVGVMGDRRSYEYVCALRAVTSLDGMTADCFPFDTHDNDKKILFLKFLNDVSISIVNNVDRVSRVVYDITSKPPATIEWE